MKIVKAKINWVCSIKRIPPIIAEKDRKTGLAYTPLIVIKGQYSGDWKNQPAWSSVVFNNTIKRNETISTITYLVESAPFELLKKDAEFELFEGNTKVASGIIIEE